MTEQEKLNAESLARTLRIGRQMAQITDALWNGPKPSKPADPFTDETKTGMFRDHSCWKCGDGSKPCCQGSPNRCEYPHARND
jgi:hypothetical protein